MITQEQLNFRRIKAAIEYIDANYKSQPSLEEMAASVHLSPYHFQRMFTDWAGVSPKRFLQYISVEHAKMILKEDSATLFDTANEIGLSGSGRLHDLFVNIEGMTPGEYKNGGASLTINYSFSDSPFGEILVASTARGICYLAFPDDGHDAFSQLKHIFPKANYENRMDENQQKAIAFFSQDWTNTSLIKLHVKGTDFQLKVWHALLNIPMGRLSTYNRVANMIGNPRANQAVGTAVGHNPVSYIIPCHRVIQSTGSLGQYHWGKSLKTAIIGWESSHVFE